MERPRSGEVVFDGTRIDGLAPLGLSRRPRDLATLQAAAAGLHDIAWRLPPNLLSNQAHQRLVILPAHVRQALEFLRNFRESFR